MTESRLQKRENFNVDGKIIELLDEKGEWHHWYLERRGSKIYFGSGTNTGMLDEGFIIIEDSLDETLSELLADLEVLINSGPRYTSKITLLGECRHDRK